jgi:hypothetical protein
MQIATRRPKMPQIFAPWAVNSRAATAGVAVDASVVREFVSFT